jgi:hypothetical protein
VPLRDVSAGLQHLTMDFFIVDVSKEGPDSLPYRLEWRTPGQPRHGGSFAAEDIADAEDMGLQYFHVEPNEWSSPTDVPTVQVG